LNFVKCPNCGVPQSLKKVFWLTNFGHITCDDCKNEYEVVKSKALPMTLAIVLPIIFGKNLPILNQSFIFVLLWAVIGLGLYFKYMPLRITSN
jgi:CXXC-20-CXXC protein